MKMPGSSTNYQGSQQSVQGIQRTPVFSQPAYSAPELAGRWVVLRRGLPRRPVVLLWKIGSSKATTVHKLPKAAGNLPRDRYRGCRQADLGRLVGVREGQALPVGRAIERLEGATFVQPAAEDRAAKGRGAKSARQTPSPRARWRWTASARVASTCSANYATTKSSRIYYRRVYPPLELKARPSTLERRNKGHGRVRRQRRGEPAGGRESERSRQARRDERQWQGIDLARPLPEVQEDAEGEGDASSSRRGARNSGFGTEAVGRLRAEPLPALLQ